MIKKFNQFINEDWNPFKKKETNNIDIKRDGYIDFLLPSGRVSYIKDDYIETECGGKGKLSDVFKGIGMDEEGHFIANCKHCDSNGILMDNHIINYDEKNKKMD